MTRAEWGHPDPNHPGGFFLGVQRQPYLVQHHTPGQDPTTYTEAVEEMQQIYAGHIGNGWSDIGYQFVIWEDVCFEGRGFGYTGAHAPGANSISLGVAMLRTGTNLPTPDPFMETFRELGDAAQLYGYLANPEALTGHRDWVATSCPGDAAYAHLGDYWATPTPPPTPATGDDDVYDYQLRPGGPFPWKLGTIDYTNFGGAVAYDYPDVREGEWIIIAPTCEKDELLVNVFYPNAKQTEARLVKFGQPARISSEQAGMVTVLAEARASGRLRIIGRPK